MRLGQLIADLRIFESQKAALQMGAAPARVTQEDFAAIKAKLDPILRKAGAIAPDWNEAWTMGGAGSWDPNHPYYDPKSSKKDSGDVDVMLDADTVMAAFPAETLRDSKMLLALYLKDRGIENNGAALNTVVKIKNRQFAVDLIVKPNAANAIRGHQMDYARDPTMRGADLWGVNPNASIWHILVKMEPSPISGKTTLGQDKKGNPISALQLSPDYGVVDRETGKVLIPWSDKDAVAKLMVGPHATARDISSISGIRTALKKVPRKWQAVQHLFPGG
jgi:hypothetical protein